VVSGLLGNEFWCWVLFYFFFLFIYLCLYVKNIFNSKIKHKKKRKNLKKNKVLGGGVNIGEGHNFNIMNEVYFRENQIF